MTEVTRVPLQPVGKGILTKLWLGIAIAILLAAGAAWAARHEGVTVETLVVGEGPSPTTQDVVLVNYEGRLPDGTVFDSGEQAAFPLGGGVIPGFAEALTRMQAGGRYEVFIPAEQGYGAEGAGPIPPDSDLLFTVELLEFRSEDEIRALQEQLRALGLGGPSAGSIPGAGVPVVPQPVVPAQ
ncbi:FKBP-type peptidyl-prolyl cis-trans isomerase [Croceicoccus sp. F390]|uniref:Peptidyl-prolyl cis-trans isomerase n=1 Tax=Croceicoccus esteveae TaxID=3075597 RepID=A0ABU2ZDG4_9SPHN|nr:FKBP-type peptidyl-prolyl cis-trans isomerase [Croceicoccus sp. F390]MDT0574648.1 FKBP-type peptidyl-prolyl cis-trans isomerase [Croceicoccus sp. F390]